MEKQNVQEKEEYFDFSVKKFLVSENIEIWDRIQKFHISTSLRLRSMFLFVSSTMISFIETISELKSNKVHPVHCISKMATLFLKGETPATPKTNLMTFVDILLIIFPDSDGMKERLFHDVYLAISPMITKRNWPQIKFDRRDALRCYGNLAETLMFSLHHTDKIIDTEVDQLYLSSYVVSIWCSILKMYPDWMTSFDSKITDFESFMKSWLFNKEFENFTKVFTASCCQIMDSMERNNDFQDSLLSCPSDIPIDPKLSTPHSSSPTIPSPIPVPLSKYHQTVHLPIHPSWRTHPDYDPRLGYPVMDVLKKFYPLAYRRPNNPNQAALVPVNPESTPQDPQKPTTKRKRPQETLKIENPFVDEMTKHKKRAKPG